MDPNTSILFVFSYLALFTGIALYLSPALVAILRTHPKRGSIFLLNLLLGWTIIGWIAALVLARKSFVKPPPQKVNYKLLVEQVVLPCKPDYNFRAHGDHRAGSRDLFPGNS
ncbi:MAG TPA: superinfection immunity protein [Pseudacidobacterium sp.]|nr:superinfection immunity protein [Pseudacidobacterium sp.]